MVHLYACIAHSYSLQQVTVIYDPQKKIKGVQRGDDFTICGDFGGERPMDYKHFDMESLPFRITLPKEILTETESIDDLLAGRQKNSKRAMWDGQPLETNVNCWALIVNTEHIESDKENYYFSVIMATLRPKVDPKG
ncbi:MAG: hypothetical protein NTY99_03840 [DPANN group archaeon]|nr:hypothetical protein [DPANN group archaeon]